MISTPQEGVTLHSSRIVSITFDSEILNMLLIQLHTNKYNTGRNFMHYFISQNLSRFQLKIDSVMAMSLDEILTDTG